MLWRLNCSYGRMKTTKLIGSPVLWLSFMLLTVVAVVAQTNTPPPLGELPKDTGAFWDLGIAAVTPVIVWIVSLIMPKIPKVILPSITPVVGIGLGLILNKVAGLDLGWVEMGKAGALAVFIREVVNQGITKRMADDTAK
jgi:hypothetical protein